MLCVCRRHLSQLRGLGKTSCLSSQRGRFPVFLPAPSPHRHPPAAPPSPPESSDCRSTVRIRRCEGTGTPPEGRNTRGSIAEAPRHFSGGRGLRGRRRGMWRGVRGWRQSHAAKAAAAPDPRKGPTRTWHAGSSPQPHRYASPGYARCAPPPGWTRNNPHPAYAYLSRTRPKP